MAKATTKKAAAARKGSARAPKATSVALAARDRLIPSPKGAPEATFPVAVTSAPGVLAPPPLIDRYPLIAGQSLNVTYLSSCFRLATTGYRQQFVDVLRELIEHDPHLLAVVQKRILAVATGRLEITAAELPEDHPDRKLAEETRDFVKTEIGRIPNLTTSIVTLLWAIFYGVSCAEIIWDRDDEGWHIDRLEFVHTRRIAWPDSQAWDAYIWDQGQVYGWQTPWGAAPTNSGVFGLRIADWPGKFLLFTPQLTADYPTRDGLGRQTAIWSLFKRIGARGAVSYLERFAKGFMDVSYKTSNDQDPSVPREANKEDIAVAQEIAAAIGPGSGSLAAHPDSVAINPKSFDGGGNAKISWDAWIAICDAQESKAVLGGTLGTEVGHAGGNRSLGEVQERSETDLEQYDATAFCETFKRDVITWLVRLNRPSALHVVPNAKIQVNAEPDPKTVAEVGEKLTNQGVPLDAEDLGRRTGYKLTPNPTKEPRRTFRTDVLAPLVVDPNLESPEAKKERLASEEADREAKTAAAQAKTSGDKPAPETGDGADGDAEPDDDEEDRKLSEAHRTVLLSAYGGHAAREVYEQLLEDYPAKSLGWILAGHWSGPREVPLGEIDFSTRASWRASTDPIEPYVDKIQSGRMKPVVLVKTPGSDKYQIVDGHHRTLAYERLERPVLAYVAQVHVDHGPWEELHAAQKKGSSKTSWVEREGSRFVNDAA